MSAAIPVAFYAPLKSPHHPSPSGDRTMARLLMKALAAAGFAPRLASTLRTFDGIGEHAVQVRLRAQGAAEADGLIAAFQDAPSGQKPRLWFTYHVYYKAPDWIGPQVATALGIPYVVAEGSRAGKRAGGPWSLGHAGAEAALDVADTIFVMTGADRGALQRAKPDAQQLIDLPPFIDLGEWPSRARPLPRNALESGRRLLTVAMMRQGDKFASYTLLADALAQLGRDDWILDIVGDGETRPEIGRLFSPFGERILFHGQVEDRPRLAELYSGADLFVWPAVNEAYGMALLEAQAFGCPVVAGANGGVASVVRNGETGVLTRPGDAAGFAAAIRMLIDQPARRLALREAARRFVAEERSLQQAAEILRSALMPLLMSEERR